MKKSTNVARRAKSKIGSAMVQLAVMASSLSVSGAATAYYARRCGNYNTRKGHSYLVDNGLGGISKDLLKYKKSHTIKTGATTDPIGELFLNKTASIRELVLVDRNIKDYYLFSKLSKPGVEVIEFPKEADGLDFLIKTLGQYQDISAVHIFSHANAGELLLGNTNVDKKALQNNVEAFNKLNKAIVKGGDLLFYGCELGKGKEGEEFLDIIKGNTHVDVAASNNLTGNADYNGDWELEIRKGDITTTPLPESVAMKDFTGVLQFNGTIDFSQYRAGSGAYNDPSFDAQFYESAAKNYLLTVNGADRGTYQWAGYGFVVNAHGYETSITLEFTNGETFIPNSISLYNQNGDDLTFYITTSKGGSVNSGSIGSFTWNNDIDISGLPDDVTSLTITGSEPFWMGIDDLAVSNLQLPPDNDATLTAAAGVTEPVGLDTTVDTVGEAVDVFDFTISDGGTSDGLATTISQVVVNVSGTSTNTERGQVTWRLNGPDVSNVTGTYNAGTITFPGLSISVADGGNETYTINAFYNDNTNLTEDRTFILSVDGDTDLTVGASGTQMGATSAVTNGTGSTIDVVATQLAFTTQPAGSVSGAALTTQPVIAARDAFGNTDVDFTETITLTEASAGSLTNNTQAATAGVATFTNLIYTATADQQSFTLTANDQDGVGSNLSTVNANSVTSDVVATKLVFTTQPVPTTVNSGDATSFTTVPVVSAMDANNTVDTGYVTDITLAEANGAGSATMSATGDTDGNGSTVSITPSSGVATFTGMQITYTASGGSSETFNLQASSGGLTTANSSQLTSNSTPTVTDTNISISGASGTGGAFKIGDTVTASWNNTAGGDNNAGITGVTVDFSEFGGGAAVAATNSSETWTATYTIVSGVIDATNRNVSVTVTNAGGPTTAADTTNATVDNIAPSVSNASIGISGATGAGGAYIIGDTVTATWNNTAGGDNNSDTISGVTVDFSAFGGGAAVVATNSAGTWTATYTIVAGGIDGTNRNVSVTATDNAGNTTTMADTTNATVDNIAPTVSSVSVPANGTYITGQNLDFTVNTNENITVNTGGGTPQIALTVGATTRQASYLSGSGTSAIVFRYTTQAGDSDTNGIAVAASIDANGGTLRDGAGNDLNATLNSVGSTASVLVDAVAPTVSSVSVPPNATYIAGQNLDFTVNTDENITVNTGGGTPQIALTMGATTRQASYLSGSGTSALVFRYTVQAGDSDTDGIAVAGVIDTNGGTLRDGAGNNLNNTLNSVGATTSVLVDAIAPTVSSVSVPANATYTAGQNLDFTINFSENVTVNTGGGTPQMSITIGSTTRQATYTSGSGTGVLLFRYTVQSGELDTDGIAVGTLAANGGTLRDGAGNNATLTLNSVGSTTAVLVGYATVTWTGATDNNWTTASNWDTNEVPSLAADVIIPSGLTNYPTASSSVTFNSLTINSGASFIPQSTVTGNITYKRNLPTTDWYLISMPIAGEVMQDIITTHPLASGTGSNLGLSYYQNSGSAWGYVTAATTGSFINGYGYSIKLTTSGDLSVTGTTNTSDVSSGITTGSRTNFNLLGNPFTAYINSATFTATNTVLLSEETVWLWNGTQYVTYNAVSPIEIAPVQGFFVESSGNGNVIFSMSNLSHQTSDTFMKQTSNNEQETLSSFELFVSGKSEQSSTKVFFVDGKTTGFDNGYDSKLFGEVDYTFAVYTGMVLGNDSKKLAIQTLPGIGEEAMKIPVGLIAETGKTITFSVQAKNLPTGVSLILEDKLNNTYVNLLEGDHSVTLKNAVAGLGKFYIHTTAKLNTEDIENALSSIKIYKSAAKELSIEGLRGPSQVVLYSLTGEKIMQTEMRSNGINKIDLQRFPIGVYIVRVSSEPGSVTKKIVLE